VELIDQLMRELAPKDDVLMWHAEERRSENELHLGNPTRALRLRYITRRREDIEPTEIQCRALLEQLDYLQGKKHGDSDVSLKALARLVPGIRACIYFIFGYEE
jgi:hypothetical protein